MAKSIHDSFPRLQTEEQIQKFIHTLNNQDRSIGSTIFQSTLKNSTHSVSWKRNQVRIKAFVTNEISLEWVSSFHLFNFLAWWEIESCTGHAPRQIESTDGVMNLLTQLFLKSFSGNEITVTIEVTKVMTSPALFFLGFITDPSFSFLP